MFIIWRHCSGLAASSQTASSAKSEAPLGGAGLSWGEAGMGNRDASKVRRGISEVQKKSLCRNPAGVLSLPASRKVDETILPVGRSHPETNQCSHPLQIKRRGCDDAGAYSQCDLPPVPSGRPSRYFKPGGKAMTEVVTALALFFSTGVFLAHAFDMYRTR